MASLVYGWWDSSQPLDKSLLQLSNWDEDGSKKRFQMGMMTPAEMAIRLSQGKTAIQLLQNPALKQSMPIAVWNQIIAGLSEGEKMLNGPKPTAPLPAPRPIIELSPQVLTGDVIHTTFTIKTSASNPPQQFVCFLSSIQSDPDSYGVQTDDVMIEFKASGKDGAVTTYIGAASFLTPLDPRHGVKEEAHGLRGGHYDLKDSQGVIPLGSNIPATVFVLSIGVAFPPIAFPHGGNNIWFPFSAGPETALLPPTTVISLILNDSMTVPMRVSKANEAPPPAAEHKDSGTRSWLVGVLPSLETFGTGSDYPVRMSLTVDGIETSKVAQAPSSAWSIFENVPIRVVMPELSFFTVGSAVGRSPIAFGIGHKRPALLDSADDLSFKLYYDGTICDRFECFNSSPSAHSETPTLDALKSFPASVISGLPQVGEAIIVDVYAALTPAIASSTTPLVAPAPAPKLEVSSDKYGLPRIPLISPYRQFLVTSRQLILPASGSFKISLAGMSFSESSPALLALWIRAKGADIRMPVTVVSTVLLEVAWSARPTALWHDASKSELPARVVPCGLGNAAVLCVKDFGDVAWEPLRHVTDVNVVTYRIGPCKPTAVPRSFVRAADYIEAGNLSFEVKTSAPIDFATLGPSLVRLGDPDAQGSIELPATVAASGSDYVVTARYTSFPWAQTTAIKVAVMLDGTHWVSPVADSASIIAPAAPADIISVFQLDSLSPFAGTTADVVKIGIQGLVDVSHNHSVRVTFADPEVLIPGSAGWNALTVSGTLSPDHRTISVKPPKNCTVQSLRLFVSVDILPLISTSDEYHFVSLDSSIPQAIDLRPPRPPSRIQIYTTNLIVPRRPQVISGGFRRVLPYGWKKVSDSPDVPVTVEVLDASEMIFSNVPSLAPGWWEPVLSYADPASAVIAANFVVDTYFPTRPPLMIAFCISNSHMVNLGPIFDASSLDPAATKFGRIRLLPGARSADVVQYGTGFGFLSPISSRVPTRSSISYAPDNVRFTSIMSATVYPYMISAVQPDNAPIGMATPVKIRGINFPNPAVAHQLVVTFLPVSMVSGQPSVSQLGVVATDVSWDTGTITATVTLQATGPHCVRISFDGGAGGGIYPPTEGGIYPSIYAPGNAAQLLHQLPQGVSFALCGYGISSCAPIFAPLVGGTVITLEGAAALTSAQDFGMLSISDSIRFKLVEEAVINPPSARLNKTSPRRDVQGMLNIPTAAVTRQPGDERQLQEYIVKGWIVVARSGDPGDATGTGNLQFRFITPRVVSAGVHKLFFSIGSEDVWVPIQQNPASLFFYDVATVAESSALFSTTASPPAGNLVILGSFLPELGHPEYDVFYSALVESVQVGFGSQGPGSLVMPAKVFSNQVICSLDRLGPAEGIGNALPARTISLYFRASDVEEWAYIPGGVFGSLHFEGLARTVYHAKERFDLAIRGAEFPFGRVSSVRFLFEARDSGHSFEQVGQIIDATYMQLHISENDLDVAGVWSISCRFGTSDWVTTGLSLSIFSVYDCDPLFISANPKSWAGEQDQNYVTVWGDGFTKDMDMVLDIQGVASLPTTWVSGHELRVSLQTLPESGNYALALRAESGSVFAFGDESLLSFAHLQSFHPLYAEVTAHDQLMTVSGDHLERAEQHYIRLGTTDVIQGDPIDQEEFVGVISSAMVATVPSDGVAVYASLSGRTTRTFNPDGTASLVTRTPIWRLVDPSLKLQVISIKSCSPLYIPATGGEVVTITFSQPVVKAEQGELVVSFAGQSGQVLGWIKPGSDGASSSVQVKSPVGLSPSQDCVVQTYLDPSRPPIELHGLSVYALTGLDHIFGQVGWGDMISIIGTYLPTERGLNYTITLMEQVNGGSKALDEQAAGEIVSASRLDFEFPDDITTMNPVRPSVLIEGNAVSVEVPTAYHLYQWNEFTPRAADNSVDNQFTFHGVFPDALKTAADAKEVVVRFSTDGSDTTVDCVASWVDGNNLRCVLPKQSFKDAVTVSVSLCCGIGAPFAALANPELNLYAWKLLAHSTQPTYGGYSFLIGDNLPANFVPQNEPTVYVDSIQCKATYRSAGDLDFGTTCAGLLFKSPPLPAGSHVVSASLDYPDATISSSAPYNIMTVYKPLPSTDAAAIGVRFSTSPPSGALQFGSLRDSKNNDIVKPVYLEIDGQQVTLTAVSFQLVNLSGAARLNNGDPIALRVHTSRGWRCVRMKTYKAAFSMDTPPLPDRLTVDQASQEYPTRLGEIMGLWRVVTDDQGHPTISSSPTDEVQIGADRVILAPTTGYASIDESLVCIGADAKGCDEPPILDLDLCTPTAIHDSVFTAANRGGVSNVPLQSSDMELVFIDAFLLPDANPAVTEYGPLPTGPPLASPPRVGTGTIASVNFMANSISSLTLGPKKLVLFASDLRSARASNIYSCIVTDDSPPTPWQPIMSNEQAANSGAAKGNIRAILIGSDKILAFSQTQGTGLLLVYPLTLSSDGTVRLSGQPITLSKGLAMNSGDGAAIFGKFEVIYQETKNTVHILTVPSNADSLIRHVSYNLVNGAVDPSSGVLLGSYGFRPPTPDGTFFSCINGNALTVSSVKSTRKEAGCISVRVQDAGTMTVTEHGGKPITVKIDAASPVDLSLGLQFTASTIGPLQTGDLWLFQILPTTVSDPGPDGKNKGVRQMTCKGIYDGQIDAQCTVTYTGTSYTASWSSGERVSIPAPNQTDPGPYDIGKGLNVSLAIATGSIPMPKEQLQQSGDTWIVPATAAFAAQDVFALPPVAGLISDTSLALAVATRHGGGCILSATCSISPSSGSLRSISLLPARTFLEMSMRKQSDGRHNLVFRGLAKSNGPWNEGILQELTERDSQMNARLVARYGMIGQDYQNAHPGAFFSITVDEDPLPPANDIGGLVLDPEPVSSSVSLLIPPLYAHIGAVEVIGSAISAGFASAAVEKYICPAMQDASSQSRRMQTGVFSPCSLYKVDYAALKVVQDALGADMTNQVQDKNNPFGTDDFWNVDNGQPAKVDAINRWPDMFKYLLQLGVAKNMYDNGAFWSTEIEHKVLGFIPAGTEYREGGADYWKRRISATLLTKFEDDAKTSRAFKYRYSVHIKEKVGALFPDIQSYGKFGGLANLLAVSLSNSATFSQLKRIPPDSESKNGYLDQSMLEASYLDRRIYSQLSSHVIAQDIINSTGSISSPDARAPQPSSSDSSTDEDWKATLKLWVSVAGGSMLVATGGLLAMQTFKTVDEMRAAAQDINRISQERDGVNGCREYYRADDSPRYAASDMNGSRSLPLEVDGFEAGHEIPTGLLDNAIKTDGLAAREGVDIGRKIEAKPDSVASPELKDYVKKGKSAGTGELAMSSVMVVIGIAGLVGDWDTMDDPHRVLSIIGNGAMGLEVLGTMLQCAIPGRILAASSAIEEAMAKSSEKLAEVGLEKGTLALMGEFATKAAGKLALSPLKALGAVANIAFAVIGYIDMVNDFKNGDIEDGILDAIGATAMLASACVDLLVVAGANMEDGVGEVLLAIVIVVMIIQAFKDPDAFIAGVIEFLGGESASDHAIDDLIARLKDWCAALNISARVGYKIGSNDSEPYIVDPDMLAWAGHLLQLGLGKR